MISLQKVSMAYGEETVVSEVDLELPECGITALIGPNGAGKSTLLGGIGRLLPLQKGTIIIDGKSLREWNTRELAQRLAILRQENHLTVRLTVAELVMLGRHPHIGRRRSPEDENYVLDALKCVDMLDMASSFLDELSGGQRQRAFVAMALAQNTKYLFLDEPLAALDMRHARDMMRHLKDIVRERKILVVIVIHDVNTAAAYADRLIALKEGKVVAAGTPKEVLQPQLLKEIFNVEANVHDIDGRPIVIPVP